MHRPFTTRNRFSLVVFDPEGDMGYGTVLGPFSAERADRMADDLRNAADALNLTVEILVLPMMAVLADDSLNIMEKIRQSGTFSS